MSTSTYFAVENATASVHDPRKTILSNFTLAARRSCQLRSQATAAFVRLSNMGNDGGTLTKRKDLVKDKKDKTTSEKSQEREYAARWKFCSLSGEPLADPVVTDWQGRLYNKEAVLEYLLGRREGSTDIKSLKDIVELKRKIDNGWRCPLTGINIQEEGDARKIVCIAKSGQVCVKNDFTECPVTGVSFDDGLIALNAERDDLQANRDRLAKLSSQGLTHSLARAKKPKAKKPSDKNQPPKAGVPAAQTATKRSATDSEDHPKKRATLETENN